ncbi:MAG: ERCC4 domain-containing protein [Kiritimatiellae bacterium]|nr:ERCC4 domain-containing protein [Kiritimatiellia bacterium]
MSETVSKLPLRIVVDSREQAPFTFAGFAAVVEVAGLEAGDYSLAGFERRVSIERKSLPDLVACLGVERDRFQRELARLRGFDAACIIVEQPQSVLRLGHFRSRMDAGAAWQSCLALSMRFRVPFFWAENRADAERICFDCLRHFARDRWRELTALNPAARIAPDATERRGPGVGMDRDGNAPERRTGARRHPLSRAQAATGAGL